MEQYVHRFESEETSRWRGGLGFLSFRTHIARVGFYPELQRPTRITSGSVGDM